MNLVFSIQSVVHAINNSLTRVDYVHILNKLGNTVSNKYKLSNDGAVEHLGNEVTILNQNQAQ